MSDVSRFVAIKKWLGTCFYIMLVGIFILSIPINSLASVTYKKECDSYFYECDPFIFNPNSPIPYSDADVLPNDDLLLGSKSEKARKLDDSCLDDMLQTVARLFIEVLEERSDTYEAQKEAEEDKLRLDNTLQKVAGLMIEICVMEDAQKESVKAEGEGEGEGKGEAEGELPQGGRQGQDSDGDDQVENEMEEQRNSDNGALDNPNIDIKSLADCAEKRLKSLKDAVQHCMDSLIDKGAVNSLAARVINRQNARKKDVGIPKSQ